MDIFSLPHRYPFHICNELWNAVLLVTAINWRHHGAPDYVNQIRATANSDFIPNLIAHCTSRCPGTQRQSNWWLKSKTILFHWHAIHCCASDDVIKMAGESWQNAVSFWVTIFSSHGSISAHANGHITTNMWIAKVLTWWCDYTTNC